jgi:hypothetical protein
MPSSILNSDDGVISGTSGLKSSGGDDGVLVFQSKGTETARINTDSQIVAAAGTASLPALTTTGDVNTGIFFPAADTAAIATSGTERMRINSSGNVGIGTSSPTAELHIKGAQPADAFDSQLLVDTTDTTGTIDYGSKISFGYYDGVSGRVGPFILGAKENSTSGNFASYMAFATRANGGNPTERMRIDSSGDMYIGRTTQLSVQNEKLTIEKTNSAGLAINRTGGDGGLVRFYQDGTEEGDISVSGSTVSYNGGHLSRWAQMLTKPDLLKGTVMSNLDEMNVYVDADGNPVENEQLNKVKVSDVEGDANVAGVFVNWDYDEAHQVDEINMAMTGDMIIRIAEGVTVARGDLLMSAGDGTAKPQGDDIVRSKTIAKVTSTHVTCTYDDGSYCVPCVLMAC